MFPAFLGEQKGNRKVWCQHYNILQIHNKKEKVNDTVPMANSEAFKEQDQQEISNYIWLTISWDGDIYLQHTWMTTFYFRKQKVAEKQRLF